MFSLKSLFYFSDKVWFLILNAWGGHRIRRIRDSHDNVPIKIRGMRSTDENEITSLYRSLTSSTSEKTPISRRLLFRILGSRTIFVASIGDQIVGFSMYYFNWRDIKQKTIHAGFTGVAKNMQGKGIGTHLRRAAIAHFSNGTLTGISSRISKTNKASLTSSLKLGFQPVEEYYDPRLKEERYYLICPLADQVSENLGTADKNQSETGE